MTATAQSQLIGTDLRLSMINRTITRKVALIDVLRQRGFGTVADAEERLLVELRLRRNEILQQLQAEHQAEYVVWAERFADLYPHTGSDSLDEELADGAMIAERLLLMNVQGHRFVFAWERGQLSVVLDTIATFAKRPDLPFDWLHAAGASFRAGEIENRARMAEEAS